MTSGPQVEATAGPSGARLPRPLVVAAWLLLALGTAGLTVWRARQASAPAASPAEGAFWEARNASGKPLTVVVGLDLTPGDVVRVRGADDALRRLQSLEVGARATSDASLLEVALREQQGRSYAAVLAPGDPAQVRFQYREEGAAPVELGRAPLDGHAIAPGTPFTLRVDVADDRFDVLVDGQAALTCRDARLTEGLASVATRRGPCTLLSLSVAGTRNTQTGKPEPFADSVSFDPAAATGWGVHAVSLGLALGAFALVALYMHALCLGRPGVRPLLTATAVALAPVAPVFMAAAFGNLTIGLPAVLAPGALGLVLGLMVLAPALQAREARGAGQRALAAAVVLGLLGAAGWVVQLRHAAELEPQLVEERLALATATTAKPPTFAHDEPLTLDAANALVIPRTYRDFDLALSATLAPDSLLELRLRATAPPSCRGVALWLPTDARLRTGFMLEDSEACERIGSDVAPVQAGETVPLALRVRGRQFEATIGAARVQAEEAAFPTGSVVLVAARGSAEVRGVALQPLPTDRPTGPLHVGGTAAVVLPAVLVLAFAAFAAAVLRLPFAYCVHSGAFAATAFALGLFPWTEGARFQPDAALAVSVAAAVLLLVPCLVQWRALTPWRGLLVLLAALLAAPVAVVAAGPRVARSPWLAWSGDHLHDDLAYFEHPVLRTLDGYLADHRFRGRQVELQKPAGTRRVVTVGGSSTYGFALPDGTGQEYPMVLERLLDEDPPGAGVTVEVLNIACLDGTGERQFRLLRDGLAGFEPDVVTVSLVYNDSFALTADDEQATLARYCDEGFRRSLAGDILESWRTLRGKERVAEVSNAFRRGPGSTLDAWRQLDLDAGQPTPPERYATLLRRFAELARERDFCLVLIKEPMRDERMLWKDEFYAAIDQVAAEYGLAVVDPGPALQAAGGKDLFMDPIHPRPQGLAIIAAELAPAVRQCLGR